MGSAAVTCERDPAEALQALARLLEITALFILFPLIRFLLISFSLRVQVIKNFLNEKQCRQTPSIKETAR